MCKISRLNTSRKFTRHQLLRPLRLPYIRDSHKDVVRIRYFFVPFFVRKVSALSGSISRVTKRRATTIGMDGGTHRAIWKYYFIPFEKISIDFPLATTSPVVTASVYTNNGKYIPQSV